MNFIPLSAYDKEGRDSTNPIWGINISDQSVTAVAGEVILAVPRDNGDQRDLLKLPKTWLPQELTRDIPRLRLLNSPEFRRAVNGDLIGLISEEDAERLLRQNGAKEEKALLRSQEQHIRKAGAPRTIADSGAEISRLDGITDDDDDDGSGRNQTVIIDTNRKKTVAQAALDGVEDVEPGITPQFKMWVDRLKTQNDMDVRNQLKSRSSYKKAELRFLQRELPRALTLAHKLIAKALGK
jgi:hypothetical protein